MNGKGNRNESSSLPRVWYGYSYFQVQYHSASMAKYNTEGEMWLSRTNRVVLASFRLSLNLLKFVRHLTMHICKLVASYDADESSHSLGLMPQT